MACHFCAALYFQRVLNAWPQLLFQLRNVIVKRVALAVFSRAVRVYVCPYVFKLRRIFRWRRRATLTRCIAAFVSSSASAAGPSLTRCLSKLALLTRNVLSTTNASNNTIVDQLLFRPPMGTTERNFPITCPKGLRTWLPRSIDVDNVSNRRDVATEESPFPIYNHHARKKKRINVGFEHIIIRPSYDTPRDYARRAWTE